jgi:hypothetical protein
MTAFGYSGKAIDSIVEQHLPEIDWLTLLGNSGGSLPAGRDVRNGNRRGD